MRTAAAAGAFVVLVACSTPASVDPSTTQATPVDVTTTAPSTTSTVALPPTNLSARPLVWFAPLPPMPTDAGRPFIGSEDFLGLFADDWTGASERVGVFKLYGEWVAYHATIPELAAAVAGIAARGMVLAVEMGPLDPPPECGQGVESFAGIDEGRLISSRLRQAGGVLQVIALDEPYYFAHVYEGEQACNWTVEQVAAAVAGFTAAMREEWPAVVVGDTEPTPAGVTVDGLAGWLDAYAAASGEPFAFLHLDPDWSRSDWAEMSAQVASAGDSRGVPVGVIFNGGAATSDAAWLASAGGRVLAYEAQAGGDPDHVVFQSWMDKPDFVLPEGEPSSFTALIDRYFDDRASLGSLVGAGSNLALGAMARALNAEGSSSPEGAVDGDADTLWTAEGGPPAGLEIDLGDAQPIGEIRLMVAQTPAGETHHIVSCLSSNGADPVVLAELVGITADAQVLVVDGGGAVCRLIRVFTVVSESWVAWREIEVYAP